MPLYETFSSTKFSTECFSKHSLEVLKIQIEEPLIELNIKKSIPDLTKIDDGVSLAVQEQYEAHPYPRWERVPKVDTAIFINSFIQKVLLCGIQTA